MVLSSHRMDDVDALCSEVTIVSRGRSPSPARPTSSRAESGEIAYRLTTTDSRAAREAALATLGVHVADGLAPASARAATPLWCAPRWQPSTSGGPARARGVAVRELAPMISPLEAAFLALTEQPEDDR